MPRPYGMHPDAYEAYSKAGLSDSRIGQTIGGAAASAGTHEKDGEYQGHDYAVCTDFRIGDLDTAGVLHFCGQLAGAGFCPYYRNPGYNGWPADLPRHVHALWPGAPMKLICRNQIHDYLHDQDGLVGHATYQFRSPSEEECSRARVSFLAHNPADS